MSESSTKLDLPYILPSQAQKHVTHNEAIRKLDALVQIELAGIGIDTPPQEPADGACYTIGETPTDAWTDKAGHLAAWQDGAWAYFAPRSGWLAWDVSANAPVVFDGSDWIPAHSDPEQLQNMASIGIGTSADANNRLAVASPGTLLTHSGASHKLRINKNAATDTSSVLFQSGWSGRAEFGLAGDDDFRVKVSPDGGQWHEALVIDSDSGAVDLPMSPIATHSMINLLGDGGRMTSGGINQISIGDFNWPSYMICYNGTSAAALAKAVHNSSTYGGSADALVPSVQELIDTIREPAHRRNGNEFWVAELTHGPDQAASTNHDSTDYYLSAHTWFQPRPAHLTFHCYVRAIDAAILVQQFDQKVVFVNGAAQTGSAIIEPVDGWVAVTIHDAQDPRMSDGYSSSLFYLYAQSAGDRYQIACPALLAGITRIDPNIGQIAPAGIWT